MARNVGMVRSTSRHFRLESQRRQGIVGIAAVILVLGAYLTSFTSYQGLPDTALAAGERSSFLTVISLLAALAHHSVTHVNKLPRQTFTLLVMSSFISRHKPSLSRVPMQTEMAPAARKRGLSCTMLHIT